MIIDHFLVICLLAKKDEGVTTKLRTRDIQRGNNLARITVTFEARLAVVVNPLLSTVVSATFTEKETTFRNKDEDMARCEAEYIAFAKQAGLTSKRRYKKNIPTLAMEIAKHGSSIVGTIAASIARNAIDTEPTTDRLSPNRKKALVQIE